MSIFVSRTPYRVSFFGGGSDYPAWYLKNGGAVLSASVNKYCYITLRKFPNFFDVKHRIVWSHIELVNSISEILHPAVREGLKMMGYDDSQGVEIHHLGDLPARAGMGSSSSFAVGLIKALAAMKDISLSKHDVALKAIDLEQNWLHDAVGSQDQVAAAYGGFNLIEFEKDGEIKVRPIETPKARLKELESHLMLFYTGANRLAKEIASGVIANLEKKEMSIRTMQTMAYEARDIVQNESRNLDEFGEMLHQSWLLKRELTDKVTNETIDRIYDTARKAGAIGGKLLGAGATGFMLFYAKPENHAKIKEALSNYLYVDFGFEPRGSTVVRGDMLDEEWSRDTYVKMSDFDDLGDLSNIKLFAQK